MKKTLLLLTLLVYLSTTNGQEKYLNKDFGFEAIIPKEWSVYKETPTPTSNYMIIAWGMPKLYSEMEKEEIENSVSITCIKSPNIKDVEDLAEKDYKRVSGFAQKIHRQKADSSEILAYYTSSIIKMKSYVTKQYFIHKNGIGYIINFTATPGTFTTNQPKFEEFFKTVKIE